MFDLRSGFVCSLQKHHIEPAGPIRQMMPGQILGSKLNQLVLLALMYGMDCPAEFFRSPRFDFYKHQYWPVFRHEVQFAQRGAEIFLDNPIALSTQILLGCCFSFLPKEASGVKDCHAIVQADSRGFIVPCGWLGNRLVRSATGAKLLRWMGQGP